MAWFIDIIVKQAVRELAERRLGRGKALGPTELRLAIDLQDVSPGAPCVMLSDNCNMTAIN